MRIPLLVLFILSLAASGTVTAGRIHDAVKAGDTNAVASLLKDTPSQVDARSDDGLTPLHLAAESNDVAVASLLVKAGAEANALTPEGKTPLQLALAGGAADAAVWLIENTGTVYGRGLYGARELRGEVLIEPTEAAHAYKVLMRRFQDKPDSENLNFALGLVCASLGEFGKAEMAFERVLQVDADNDRARFEMARVAMAAGRLPTAKREFETVLAHRPQAPVEERVRSYLREIERQMSRWRFAGRLDAGWMRDDNVNIGPNSATINIAPIQFGSSELTSLTLNPDSLPIAAEGVYASLAASGIYDLGDTAGWMLVGDAAYFRNWLRDNAAYESQFYQVAAGMRYAGVRNMLQATVKAGRVDSGREPLVDISGISPILLHASSLMPNLTWMTSGQCEIRNYSELRDRDSVFTSLGETARYGFGRGRHSVSAGVMVCRDDTRADAFDYTGVAGTLGAEIGIGRRVTLYGQCRYMDSEYKGRETLAPEDRADRQLQATVGISAVLWRKWGLDVRHQYTDNDSTFDLYRYERNLTTVGTWVSY